MVENKLDTRPDTQVPLFKALFMGQTLYVRILTAFISVIIITVLPIIIYGYVMDRDLMLGTANNSINQATNMVIRETTDYLMPLSKMAEFSAMINNGGALSLRNKKQLEDYGLEVLKFYPPTAAFYFGDEQGNFLMIQRLPDGTIATDIVNRKGSLHGPNFIR